MSLHARYFTVPIIWLAIKHSNRDKGDNNLPNYVLFYLLILFFIHLQFTTIKKTMFNYLFMSCWWLLAKKKMKTEQRNVFFGHFFLSVVSEKIIAQ